VVIGRAFPEIDAAMRERIVSRFARPDTWSRDQLLKTWWTRRSPGA